MTTPIQHLYANERRHLATQIAKRVKLEKMPNAQRNELVVHYPNANLKQYPLLVKAMELFCWPTNTKAQRWVEDPIVDAERVEGKWRLVSVRADVKEIAGIVITLREGYATAINWDEAMLATSQWLQEAERYAEIIFPNLDPTKVQELADSFPSHTTASLTIQGQTFAATEAAPWEYIRVKPELQEDGSAILRVFMAKPQYLHTLYEEYGTPEQVKRIYVNNVPKRLESSIVTTYNAVTGASGTAKYATDQGTVDLVFTQHNAEQLTIRAMKTVDGCQLEEYSDYFYNLTRAEAEAFSLTDKYGERAVGWMYRVEGVTYAGRGRWTVKAIREHALPVTKDAITIEDTADHTTTLTASTGQTSVTAAATGTGFVETLRVALDRFCSWTVDKIRRTAKARTLTFVLNTTNGNTITYIFGLNQSGEFTSPACPQNQKQTGSFTPNEDGTYNYLIQRVTDDTGLALGDTMTYKHVQKVWRAYRSIEEPNPSDPEGEPIVIVEYQSAKVTRTVVAKLFATMKEAVAYGNVTFGSRESTPYAHLGLGMYLGFATSEWTTNWRTDDD